jgi:ribulose-phosphate 3-epimerase
MHSTIGSSIICMDHIDFKNHVLLAERIGIDFLHLDVMDGHFVPRYGIYPEIIRSMAEITQLKMDLHLMVSDPEFALSQLKNIENIEYVSIHMDGNQKNIVRILDAVKNQGYKPVMVIDLGTDTKHVAQFVNDKLVNGLMFMGIHPGVLTQTAKPEIVISKINKLRQECDIDNLFIQCDGGVSFETIPNLKLSGINNFICGSSTLYKDCNFRDQPEAVYQKILENKKKIDELVYNAL